MKILFVHQNMPGQYREFVEWLADQGEHEIVFLTQRRNASKVKGATTRVYKSHHNPAKDAYGLSKVWEAATGVGYGAMLSAQALQKETGFLPDIILGHTGWGELLFFKELWPDVPIIGFFEYYYRAKGGLVGFDPAEKVAPETQFLMYARNSVPFASIQSMDIGQCPTEWQKNTFPTSFHDKFYVCHDGIRTDKLTANPDASVKLSRVDRPVTRNDEVFTFLARNLEYARGFHIFMRALPEILKARPNARVLVVGGNDVSYGRKSKHPNGLRGEMEDEVGNRVDWSRVHFLGQVPYEDYRKIVQLSRCHIALTMPFVMSWSLLEAMAMQATVVASNVPSVSEAVTHGETGLLVDFFDHQALAKQVIDVLANPKKYAHIGPAARAHVVEKYDFYTKCLPVHVAQINSLLPADKHIQL